MGQTIEWYAIDGTRVNVATAMQVNADVEPEDPMETGEIAVIFDGDSAAILYGDPDRIVAKLRAALAEAERLAKIERDRPDEVALSLRIKNHYDTGTVTTFETVNVPHPPYDEEEREEWEQEHIFPATGTGQEHGDPSYDVTVTGSSQPDLIPVGTTYEFF